jgi:preprotein translocase subunit SecB
MKPSPLHLTDYFVTDLHVSANPKFDSKQEIPLRFEDFQVAFEATCAPEKKREWQVILKLAHQPPAEANVPYRFTAEIVGIFVLLDGFPEERIERLVKTNGASMLYGVLREIIRATTARGPYSAIILPSTSFYEPEKKPETPAASPEVKPQSPS